MEIVHLEKNSGDQDQICINYGGGNHINISNRGQEFGVIKVSEGRFKLIKVINEYSNHEEATDAMLKEIKKKKKK